MTLEAKPKTPPMEWYGAIAFPEEGIRYVFIGGPIFRSLDPDLNDKILDWMHTLFHENIPDVVKFHEEAGAFVQKVTGFTPERLTEYARELGKRYAGQSMGPFQFHVTWII